MKLKIIHNVLVFLFLFVSCAKEQIKIAFETEEIDIGLVKADTVVNIIFKPINKSKNILRIYKVTSDCHCTVARGYQKHIKANETGEIKVSYNSKGFGYFEQLIEVFSNAENSPSLLIVKGRVELPDK